MKKIILTVVTLILGIFLTACSTEPKVYGEVSVIVPFGTPLLAVGGLIGTEGFDIEAVNDPSLLTAAMVTKEKDIIIAPITAGTASYIKGGSVYKMAGIVTLGNTYIASRTTSALASVADLEGKAITAYGQNNTPDIALKVLLDNAGLFYANDEANHIVKNVDINYQSSVADVVALFNGANAPEYILIAEPFLTKLQANIELNVLNVQEVLSEAGVLDQIFQAAVFINPNGNLEDINNALNKIEANLAALNANYDAYSELIVNKHNYFTSLGEAVLKASLPSSNLEYVKAVSNKAAIEKYYGILNTYNKKLFNELLPPEDFYYSYE